ncbi:OprD family porin [Pseudomonas sp. CM25]|uniref:OprD family porin n=1 Tax=Pseudomonas sp. CM25 TaxID=2738448 RepID=UPI001558201F|nr:OprD family porin [Pseudomonas sp. CM25]NQD59078.1 OprD family porin [Pseudomonas sp. CM25]
MRRYADCLPVLALGVPCVCLSTFASAGFLEDSTLALTTRNYYLDRDYKGESTVSAVREWAQGFIFKANSGYTDGPVGFGLDLTGMLGIKLDSSPERSGTQLLPVDPQTRRAKDEYSELGVAVKARFSQTRVSLGTQLPTLPVITASPARLLPQTFQGASITSSELEKLTLQAGRMDRVNLRDSTNNQPLAMASPNGRFKPGVFSDRFDYLGGEYRISENFLAHYYHARLENIYEQDFIGGIYSVAAGRGKLKTELRVFDSRENGRAEAGSVDNLNAGLTMSYQTGGHTLGLGYMYQSGDTAFAYLAGGEPVVLSDGTMSADFVNPKERTMLIRYDYNFVAMGIPGLTGMVRYLRGSNIDLPHLGGRDLTESSKDLELSYVIQSGPAKDLAFRVRHAFYRNDLSAAATFRDDNETRVNIDYTLKF